MKAKFQNNTVLYEGEGYKFSFKEEKHNNYASLIVKPNHLKLLSNETDLSDSDLKANIIQDWFAEENERVRERNNRKAKERRKNV